MTDKKNFKYATSYSLDVRRIDNEVLTDEENDMVREIAHAIDKAIADTMAKHGNTRHKVIEEKFEAF